MYLVPNYLKSQYLRIIPIGTFLIKLQSTLSSKHLLAIISIL